MNTLHKMAGQVRSSGQIPLVAKIVLVRCVIALHPVRFDRSTQHLGVIDQPTYRYGDAARPDRLTPMADAGSATKGFIYTAVAAADQYDVTDHEN